jgi:hypothetical protein
MYRSLLLITFLFSLTLFSYRAAAQQRGNVSLQSIEEMESWTVITLQCDQPFIIGANRYVLYIGNQPILKSDHPNGDVTLMQFFLTQSESSQLVDGAFIRLSYGLIRENSDGLPDFTSPNPILYEVGNWSK